MAVKNKCVNDDYRHFRVWYWKVHRAEYDRFRVEEFPHWIIPARKALRLIERGSQVFVRGSQIGP